MSGKKNNLIEIHQVSNFKGVANPENIRKLTLVVTKGCNFKCDYCYEKHNPEVKMDVQMAIDAIEYYKPELVKFFGGEPLANRELIRKVMDTYPDLRYELVTNGTYIHKLDPKYWNMFENVNISIDGLYDYDSLRYSSRDEYDRVVGNIVWLTEVMNPNKLILNVSMYIDKVPDYTLLERMADLEEATGLTSFDVNLVMFDSDNNFILSEESRTKFMAWAMDALRYSILNGYRYKIDINEAIFASKKSRLSCCAFRKGEQITVDATGFQSHCHAAAYQNVSDETLNDANKKSKSACAMIEVAANRNDSTIEVDNENFKTISHAEYVNNNVYDSMRDNS